MGEGNCQQLMAIPYWMKPGWNRMKPNETWMKWDEKWHQKWRHPSTQIRHQKTRFDR
jgi:hypothetical protein